MLQEVILLLSVITASQIFSHPYLDVMKAYEGFAPRVYTCPAGKKTIGYGHIVQKGEDFGRGISKWQGDLLFMKDVDLYSCIGNALDNAITAVEKVPEEDKKLIALSLVRKNGMLCLHIENYYVGELDIRGGILRTTKEDKRSHGIGMRSIEMIAKKYDGSVSFSGEDHIFRLNIVFAVPEKTEKEENA